MREADEQDVQRDLVRASSAARRPRPARSCDRGTTRPGSAVMRTTMRSESTLVPPVTAERSPPLSRMTGADSPVIADSSTEAMPSMTSPSPGMSSPGLDDDDVALAQLDGGHVLLARRSTQPARRRSPCACCAASSACALPRPSAIASAKLAKSTVNQSQQRDRAGEPERRAPARREQVAQPERAWSGRCRPRRRTSPGSWRRAAGRACEGCRASAGARIAGSKSETLARRWHGMPSERPSRRGARKCSTIGPSESAGKKVSAPTMTMTPTSSADEERAVGREGARARRARSSCRPSSRRCASTGTIIRKRPDEHREAERDVAPGRVGVEAGEGRAVVARRRSCRRRGSRDRPCGPALLSDDDAVAARPPPRP